MSQRGQFRNILRVTNQSGFMISLGFNIQILQFLSFDFNQRKIIWKQCKQEANDQIIKILINVSNRRPLPAIGANTNCVGQQEQRRRRQVVMRYAECGNVRGPTFFHTFKLYETKQWKYQYEPFYSYNRIWLLDNWYYTHVPQSPRN